MKVLFCKRLDIIISGHLALNKIMHNIEEHLNFAAFDSIFLFDGYISNAL